MPMPGRGREIREFSPPSGISTYAAPKKDSMAASDPMEEDSLTWYSVPAKVSARRISIRAMPNP